MMDVLQLGEICEHIVYGVTASAVSIKDGPRFLRITDISDVGVDWDKVPSCKLTQQELERSKLIDGDIVVARTGGTVGKSLLITDPPEAVCASYLLRLRPNARIVQPQYLELFLRSDLYWNQLASAAQGAAQPNVSGTTLSKISIPVPNIETQCRIVGDLRDKLTNIATAKVATQTQCDEIEHLAQALVFESVNSSKTQLNRVGSVLEEVTAGVGLEWKRFPVLGATREGLAPAREKPGKHPERYKPVFPGTVFYNPMRILIGSVAFVDDDDAPGITSPDYVVLRGKPGVVDSRWFYHWLRSPLGERCVASFARGAVRERMLFNRLAEGEIELPDYAVQLRASKALAALKPMKTALAKQLQELELLPKKILARVFEG